MGEKKVFVNFHGHYQHSPEVVLLFSIPLCLGFLL